MINLVLFCILWAKPETELKDVRIDEYGLAQINQSKNGFQFEASVIEEKLNSVKITDLSTGFSTEANASRDLQQKSFYIKLDLGPRQASLDCDLRRVNP